jgi:transcriptional regulator with GAF, ATPase, and Fis domain
VRPLGVTRALRVDLRVVAATNRDLLAAVARGEFRADLYDRLSEVVLDVPPLRERREDIAGLAEHFVGVYAPRHGVAVSALARETVRALCAYDWPGNVRQREVLRIASLEGAVGRRDVTGRFAISGESARRDLGALVRAGLLRRSGRGRGTHYLPLGAHSQ